MGTRTAVLIRHDDFPKLPANKDLGEYLHFLSPAWMKKSQRTEPVPNEKGYHFLGQTDADKSLAVVCYKGVVWCPREVMMTKKNIEDTRVQSGKFSIIDFSGDCSSLLCNRRKFGSHLVEALSSFKRDPSGQVVNVNPYGQAIAIVGTFSPDDSAILILEGNGSWLVGKEPTPAWSRAAQTNHSRWKEVQELILALGSKTRVDVDLSSKKIQEIIVGYF